MPHSPDLALEREHFDKIWSDVDTRTRITSELSVSVFPSLKGKRVLICSCGTGLLPVEAARAGAEVYAVDISEVAVANARAMAEYNDVQVHCSVQDLHKTGFEDGFFDLVYGSAILHHLDVSLACREFRRVLRSGGFAIFVKEPTFKNPLIKFAYETAFGRGREGRKRRFLCFRRTGTDNEKPLDQEEFQGIEKFFPDFRLTPCHFMFFQKFSHVTGGKLGRWTALLDGLVSRLFPFLRNWSYEFDLEMHG